MSRPALHFVVPGSLRQRTGGYLYDGRIVDGLRARDWDVTVHNLDGQFPDADETARASFEQVMSTIPDGAQVVVDGLALAGGAAWCTSEAARLDLRLLVHHPLSDETGLDADRRRRLAEIETAALRAARGIIVTSAYTARGLGRFGVEAARIRVVEPGTDPAPLSSGPPAGEAPILLVVGSVIPRKGHDMLVRALARLREHDWRCVCAGSLERDPRFAAAVREAVQTAGLAERVTFVGECDAAALDRWYVAASLFVLPSHYEGYGMVLAEALAHGLPIVSTSGGAIPDTVPRDAGRLVPPGDEVALAETLAACLDTNAGQPLLACLRAAARRHAPSMRRWDTAIDTMVDALSERRPVPPTDVD